MDETLLDTDILSEVLKRKDQRVLAKAQLYLSAYQRFAFSGDDSLRDHSGTEGYASNAAARGLPQD